MSDYELPELPSDKELGIDEDGLDDFVAEDQPELSAEEMLAFLGKKEGEQPPGSDEPPSKPPKKKVREPEGPRSRWKGPLTLAVLLAVASVSSSLTGIPGPVAVNAPDSVFSSGRAMAHLVEIARRAHPTGSPEHTRVRGYLLDRLRDLGLDPEVQTATTVVGMDRGVRAATIRNVVARIPGSASTGAILVVAHYDGAGISRAAGDDGAGVVAILEALRALGGAGAGLRNDVIVLLTDGEELDLLGARAFVNGHPWAADVSLVLNLEMRGAGGPVHMFQTGEDGGWAVRALAEGDPAPTANSISIEVYRRMPNSTDFTVFRDAGMQGLDFAAIGRGHVYHQAYDAPANLSEATLQQHGIHVLGMLRYLGGQDLSAVDAPDVVYFTVPILGLVVYPALLVLPITVVLLVVFAFTVLVARQGGARMTGLAVGLVIAVLAGGLTFAAGSWLVGWVPRFHPEAGHLYGTWLHSSGWYLLALACVAFTAVTALHALARRWLSAVELALGAAVVPAVLAVGAGFVAPLGAMDFQWPALACALAVLALALLSGPRGRWLGWALCVLLAVPALVFLVPVVEGLWMAMSFRMAALLGALVALILYLTLPALEALREPNAWWAPALGLLAGAVFLGVGVLSSGPSAERPLPSTLVYTFDHATGEALWITGTEEDPADSPARSWAQAAAAVTFGQSQPMSDFLSTTSPVPVARADAGLVPPPEFVRLATDSTDVAGTVRIGIRSAVAAEVVEVRLPPTGTTRVVAINGVPLEGTPWVIEHWGVPDTLIVLDLRVEGGGEPSFQVLEHLLRPQELVGPSAFERPEGIAPDVSRGSDRAILRSVYGGTATGPPAGSAAPGDSIAVTDTTAVAPGTASTPPDTGRATGPGAGR